MCNTNIAKKSSIFLLTNNNINFIMQKNTYLSNY